jgi:DNA-binding NarL/FixJ family response regulator
VDGIDDAPRRLTIVVADDEVLLRQGLSSLLERSGFDVVGEAADGRELVELVSQLDPDLAVVDIKMPPSFRLEGLEAAKAIRRSFPRTGILVLSAHVEVEHALDLLAGGERIGYLLKSRITDVHDLIDALERIANGRSVIDSALVRELVGTRHRDDPLKVLTDREREVLALMAEGRSNAGIARRIYVSEGTVEKHIRAVLTKLDLPATEDDHRRILAVLSYLENR